MRFAELLEKEIAAAGASTGNDATWIALRVYEWLARDDPSEPFEVDWQNRPSKYKTYPGALHFALDALGPLSFSGDPRLPIADYVSVPDTLTRLAHLLGMAAGPASLRIHSPSAISRPRTPSSASLQETSTAARDVSVAEHFFRFIPSGGALYPWELYSYWRGADLPRGIYHYDAARHCFEMLAAGDFDSCFRDVLGAEMFDASADILLIASTVYAKSGFKYSDYCTHLLGLDAGVLVGQLAYLAHAFRFEYRAHYRFQDPVLCEILGISLDHEAPHAVICLWDSDPGSSTRTRHCPSTSNPAAVPARRCDVPQPAHLAESCGNPEPCSIVRLINRASIIEREISQPPSTTPPEPSDWPGIRENAITLARRSTEWHRPLATILRERMTGIDALRPASMEAGVLHDILAFSLEPLATDISDPTGIYSCVAMIAVVNRVDGIRSGVYHYDPAHGSLTPISQQPVLEQARLLQQLYRLRNVSFFSASAVLFVAADYARALSLFGNRGLRLLDHLGGWIVQRCGIATLAADHGFHPLFGIRKSSARTFLQLRHPTQSPLLAILLGTRPASGSVLHMPLWN